MSKLVDMAVKMYEGLTEKEKEVLRERFRTILEKTGGAATRLVALDALRDEVDRVRRFLGYDSVSPSPAEWKRIVELADAARPQP